MGSVVSNASHQLTTTTTGVLWASIVASATVAVITTLLVEYLAKPRLEVRKDRILERSQRRRTALRGLERALTISGRLLALRDKQGTQLFRDRAIQFAAEVTLLVVEAHYELEAPAPLNDGWNETAAAAEAFLLLLQNDVPTVEAWDDFDAKTDKLGLYADLFTTPRWRWWNRRKLTQRITSLP